MPYIKCESGLLLWVGKMTPAEEREHMASARGLKLFPSFNTLRSSPAAHANPPDCAVSESEPPQLVPANPS